MGKSYMFNNVQDMIDLASYIQSNVYLGYSFYLDNDSLVSYKELWDIINDKYNNEDIVGITIDESGFNVIFIRK